VENFSLTFCNTSSRDGSFVCFQPAPGVATLVWWAKYTHPNTRVRFEWATRYAIVWSEVENLNPGTIVWPNEILAADPLGRSGPNTATLDHVDGAFEFQLPGHDGTSGELTIRTGASVPAARAVAGIGMSGLAIAAAPVFPNQSLQFTPPAELWIGFGHYKAGEVIDPVQFVNAVQIVFPANVTAMTAIYDDAGTWTVAPTPPDEATL
jgi:hypothetical protein